MSRDLSTSDLIALFRAAAEAIAREKGRLCELDGIIGDADHGITMEIGFTAVTAALEALDPATATPTEVFNTAAKAFLNAVGASAGPLYATAFMRAGAAVKGKTSLGRDDAADVVVAMAEGVRHRGQAALGDKTMIDAWLPAADAAAAAKAADEGLVDVLAAAARAALAGAEATAPMIAAKGRSARLGERAIGHVDPGAASTAVVLAAFADAARGLG